MSAASRCLRAMTTESFLRHQVGLAFAANAGGINKAEALTIALDDFIHGIAGGAGNRRDDGTARAGKPVQQRGLADIGMADDGDFGFRRWSLVVGRLTRCLLLGSASLP